MERDPNTGVCYKLIDQMIGISNYDIPKEVLKKATPKEYFMSRLWSRKNLPESLLTMGLEWFYNLKYHSLVNEQICRS